jgi:hypothetical protein
LGNLSTPKTVQKLQKALHAKAKAESGYRFYALYDKISREDILAHAYAQCRSDGIAEGPCHAEMAAFNDLIETAPVTFAGLVAWSSYLDEIEPWMFEERGPTLVVTLVEALGNLAVAS